MNFDNALFWPAFAQAGFLSVANVTQTGDSAKNVDVSFRRPGEIANGIITTQYEIEYQRSDLATLAEGDPVTIGSESFKVRQAPVAQGDGFFYVAALTKL